MSDPQIDRVMEGKKRAWSNMFGTYLQHFEKGRWVTDFRGPAYMFGGSNYPATAGSGKTDPTKRVVPQRYIARWKGWIAKAFAAAGIKLPPGFIDSIGFKFAMLYDLNGNPGAAGRVINAEPTTIFLADGIPAGVTQHTVVHEAYHVWDHFAYGFDLDAASNSDYDYSNNGCAPGCSYSQLDGEERANLFADIYSGDAQGFSSGSLFP
jgi:hypothetical protein